MEASTLRFKSAVEHLATGKRGLKHGLSTLERAVILMLDETVITETPPLYSCYGPIGKQLRVPISGSRAKRVLHGVINIRTGDVLMLITEVWDRVTHQYFLEMIRGHWRGWNIVLFEDRGSPHRAEETLDLAKELRIQIRFLPIALHRS
jgi:hypothetical protein